MVTEVLVEAMEVMDTRPGTEAGLAHMAAEAEDPRLEVSDIAVDLFIAALLQDLDVIIGIKDLLSRAEEIADMEVVEEEEAMDGPVAVLVTVKVQLDWPATRTHILTAPVEAEEAPDGLVQDGQIP